MFLYKFYFLIKSAFVSFCPLISFTFPCKSTSVNTASNQRINSFTKKLWALTTYYFIQISIFIAYTFRQLIQFFCLFFILQTLFCFYTFKFIYMHISIWYTNIRLFYNHSNQNHQKVVLQRTYIGSSSLLLPSIIPLSWYFT